MKEIYIHGSMLTSVFGNFHIQWSKSYAVSLLTFRKQFIYWISSETVERLLGNEACELSINKTIQFASRTKFYIGQNYGQ